MGYLYVHISYGGGGGGVRVISATTYHIVLKFGQLVGLGMYFQKM